MATHNYSFTVEEALLWNVTMIICMKFKIACKRRRLYIYKSLCGLIETQCHGCVPTHNNFNGTNKCWMLLKNETMHENILGLLWQPFVCFLDENLSTVICSPQPTHTILYSYVGRAST